MSIITVAFIGAHETGNTSLISCFKNGRTVPEDGTGAHFYTAYLKNKKLNIWDISGNLSWQDSLAIKTTYLRGCNICAITLDLSKPFNEKEFAAEVKLIRELNPNIQLILVGCKKDLPRKIEDDTFETIRATYNISYKTITSSRDETSVNHLFINMIAEIGSYQNIENYASNCPSNSQKGNLKEPNLAEMKAFMNANSPLYIAIEKLEKIANKLPPELNHHIKTALAQLIVDLRNPRKDPLMAINEFSCKRDAIVEKARELGVAKSTLAKVREGFFSVIMVATLMVLFAGLIFGTGLAPLVISSMVGAGLGYKLAKQGFFGCTKSPPLTNDILESFENVADISDRFTGQPALIEESLHCRA